ncbi:hypothetical protein LSAT2_025535 [Lamellibrachia satsuma]|nr:hypothetical protein LSAT2_025535 [Lamellibrachia satsuma]
MNNADIRQWPLHYWQVSKVYMGRGQDQSSVNPLDTDASGVLQLLNNCKHFINIVDTTKVDAVRQQRNLLMHSKTMKLTVNELSGVMQTMTDLLNDYDQRHSDPAAQQAVADIQQIEHVVIDINDKVFLDNERNAWKQVLASQSSAIQQHTSDIQQHTSDIHQHTSDIHQHASDIHQQASDIQQHTSDIHQHASDIQQVNIE